MKKYAVLLITIISIITLKTVVNSQEQSESCGKISDYTFEDGNSNVIVANRNAGKQIAITFDDGPCEKYTPEILEILKNYNVKATFFVIGKNAEKHPELLKQAYNAGHEIGNHTYSAP